tara:strand:+ start:211 stop:885 length:675 start_codon:yes stop_codon:yes gene_type:complete
MSEYIKFTLGGRNYEDADGAFDALTGKFKALTKQLGELTPVFDKISPTLVKQIKQRFDTDELDFAPYNQDAPGGSRRSQFTKKIRRNPGGPTLKNTGRLQKSISRLGSPTKNKSGGQREVMTLRIGSRGVPYAQDHLFGGTWEVPIFQSRQGRKYINYDRIAASEKTNSGEYKSRWPQIKKMTQTTAQVEIPQRNFLLMDDDMVNFVIRTVSNFTNKVIDNAGR